MALSELETLYILDTERLAGHTEAIEAVLPRSRAAKASSYIRAKDRLLSLGAGLLLKGALDSVGTSEDELSYTPHGKPYLPSGTLFFNLSHSESTVALALSESEVGCDAEHITQFDPDLKRRVFTSGELRYAALQGEEDDRVFTRLWCMKESVMKYFGVGLSIDPLCLHIDPYSSKPVSFGSYKVSDLNVHTYELGGCMAAVCTKEKRFTERQLTLFDLI